MKMGNVIRCLSVAALVGGMGCDPVSDDHLGYYESLDHDADQQRVLAHTMTEWNSVDGAVDLVKSTDAPAEEEGSTEDWIARSRAAVQGDVMFPRWEGRRLGANRFEVRYSHTMIDFDYNIEKSGFKWEVDTMLKLVRGPTPLEPEELETRPRRSVMPEPLLEEEGVEEFSLE